MWGFVCVWSVCVCPCVRVYVVRACECVCPCVRVDVVRACVFVCVCEWL